MQKGFSAAHPAGFGMLTWVRWWPWGERGTAREARRCHSGSEGRFWGASTMTGVFSTFYLMTHAGTKKQTCWNEACLIGQKLITGTLCVIEKYLNLIVLWRISMLALTQREKSATKRALERWNGSSVSVTGSALQLQNSIVVTFFSDIVIMWTFSFQIK